MEDQDGVMLATLDGDEVGTYAYHDSFLDRGEEPPGWLVQTVAYYQASLTKTPRQ